MDAVEPPSVSAPAPVQAIASPWAPTEPARPERTLELGAAAFLFSGAGAGSYVGASPFLVAELGHSILLRPSVAFGQAEGIALRSSWGIGRMDTCARLAGLYTRGSGIQLDLCGGLEAGLSYVASGTQAGQPKAGATLPYVAIGPSVDLRAELGTTAAVTLRAVVGVDLAGEGYTDVTGTRVDASLLPARLELGFSWDMNDVSPPQAEPVAQVARVSE